jgi:Dihydroneopterin aldolase
MMDPLDRDSRIHIHQLDLMAHLGVPDDERATAQRLTCNLTLRPGRPFGELNDRIERAVNYAAVCAE